MNLISIKSIETAVNKIDSLDDDALEKLSETFALQQESVVGYILSSAVEFENDLLMELLVYYYTIFMESINQEGLTLKPIAEGYIDNYQEEYLEVIEEYMETEDFEIIDSFCNQTNLLGFLMNEIEMEDQNGERLNDETASLLFTVGVALIGIIDRNLNK